MRRSGKREGTIGMSEQQNDIELRPALRRFAVAMERKLRANDYKGGWEDEPLEYLIDHAWDELHELNKSLFPESSADPALCVDEAADIANYCMMIADRFLRERANA